jgi:hypothetical protein
LPRRGFRSRLKRCGSGRFGFGLGFYLRLVLHLESGLLRVLRCGFGIGNDIEFWGDLVRYVHHIHGLRIRSRLQCVSGILVAVYIARGRHFSLFSCVYFFGRVHLFRYVHLRLRFGLWR